MNASASGFQHETPLVAVVITVYDTPSRFFREAIESVRAQREDRWELVIVLDASNDECAHVARQFAADDPRIRVVGEAGGTPRGLSAARNFGVSHTNAPVIALLDGDDVFEPLHLSEGLRLLEKHGRAAMAFGTSLYWYSWNGNETDGRRDHVPPLHVEPDTLHAPPVFVLHFIQGLALVPCPCSIFVRRSAMDAIGGFDESFRDLYEDQVFYARLALRFPVVAHGQVLDRYRQHPASMTASAGRAREHAARTRFLNWLESEVAAVGLEDRTTRHAIAWERWHLRHPGTARVLRGARKGLRLASAIIRRRR
jgi:glycosyltransferase involved in cell wall biosynthesis